MLRWGRLATVIRREYFSRVKTRAFWLSTAAVPLVMVAFLVIPTVITRRGGGEFKVALVTQNSRIADAIEREVTRLTNSRTLEDRVKISLVRISVTADPVAQREQLKHDVIAKRFHGALLVPDDVIVRGRTDYLSKNVVSWKLMGILDRAVEAAVIHARLAEKGVSAEQADTLTKGVTFNPIRIGKNLSESSESGMESFFVAYTMMFILWITQMIYGFYVMRGVIEEKSSRIVEVIVANLHPYELMVGKILGIGAVGLTQYAIWILLAMNLAVPGLTGVSIGGDSSSLLSPTILIFFAIFFVLGFFLHATFYAAVGASFNTEEESQQMQTIVGWVIAIPFMFTPLVMNNPDSPFSVIFSLIPVFSPVIFFLRMILSTPPWWQTVLCLVLLVGTIYLISRVTAAIYRIGILMYGKKPSLREIWRWTRSS